MPSTNDKNQKQLNTRYGCICKDADKGFTLVELIVAITVLGIMLTLSVSGLLSWRDWSDFNRVNEYAETMFLSAQNQLSEYNANGTLQDFGARVSAAGVDKVPVDKITAEDGLPLTEEIAQISASDKHYIWMSENKGTLVCVRADKGDYSRYLKGAETNSATAPFVFELLDSYIYDQSLLNETICIEFSLEDGQVFSVLFTDKFATEGANEYSRFIYSASNSGRGEVSILDRQETARKERMTGYYGVDTLSKAIKGGQKKIAVSELELHNEETLYLTYGVSNASGALSSLNYDITIRDADEPDKDFLTFTLDGTKLKNTANKEVQNCVVTRNRYEASTNSVVSTSLGEMPIMAWINDKGKIEILLDGADFQANTSFYEDAMKVMMADGVTAEMIASNPSATKFMSTYSFHRFGLDVDNIYCEVKAYGAAHKASPVKQSNTENAYFAAVDVLTNATNHGNDIQVLISNARHLNNIRYVADCPETDLAGYWSTYAKASNTAITYRLIDDIDWAAFVDAGYYFDTKTAGATALDSYEGQFVSIKKIGQKDTIDGASFTITGLEISEINNASAFVYADAAENQRPVGLVCTNFGSIHHLSLDQIKVYSNSDKVGAFCGVNVCSNKANAGRLYNLAVLNTSEEDAKQSTVTGKEHVGGIVGYLQGMEDITAQDGGVPVVTFENLTNEAEVTGIKFVGGIVGEIRIPEDKMVSVTVKACENTGAVYARTKVGNNTVAADKSGFIGGITGYVANMYKAGDGTRNENLIRIVDCVSTPEYSAEDVTAMLENNLNGVYVGGIIGFNYYGKIENCSTKAEDDKVGYVFGNAYVGGITGYNRGAADGISGTKKSENTANVIGVKYVGGITGCNAKLEEQQADIEKLEAVAEPVRDAYYEAEIRNWENKGFVLATDSYVGGVSGYNTGWIFNCESNIDSSRVVVDLKQRFSGDYVGGITGYNNGIIGNTIRNTNDKTQINDSSSIASRKKNISSDIAGTNYVGGVVGYNDEAAIIEDYAVSGGSVRGSGDGCFVGGYVGFNASPDLLQYGDGTAKTIEAKPTSVSGGFFVGGVLGGNIINTSGYTASSADIPVYSALTVPEVTDDDATETQVPGQSGGSSETPLNEYSFSFDRIGDAYYDGAGPDIISEYTIRANALYGGNMSNWRVEIDIPEDVEISVWRDYYNIIFTIVNNKLVITPGNLPMDQNVFVTNGQFGFAMKTHNSIDYFRFSNSEARFYIDNKLQAVQKGIGADQNERNYEVELTLTGTWMDNNRYIANYQYIVRNTSSSPVEDWGVEIDITGLKFDVINGWVKYEKKDNKLIIVPQFLYNNSIPPYGIRDGQFQISGKTEKDVNGLLLADATTFEYYEGTPGKPNDPPDDQPAYVTKYAMNVNYNADNASEIINGNAFVGGFTGYNLLIDNSDAGTEHGYVAALSQRIVSQMNANAGSLTAQYNIVNNMKALTGLSSALNISDVALVINGQTSEVQVNKLNKVEGNLCVGGIVGYSNDDSRLYIKNTANHTPVIAKQDVIGSDGKYYSYAGGIIGNVGAKTVLENCTATALSIVASKGSYRGAICETNAGYLLKCSSTALSVQANTYGAGLCGINQENAMIKDSLVEGVSIKGEQMAGAFVAVNHGYIDNPSMNGCSVISTGAAGGVAAYNGVTGIIRLVHNINDINIASTGDNVGGIVGLNDGVIVTASAEADYKITVTGSVSGHDTVGGIVGKNAVHNNNSKIGFFTNRTNVTAQNGNVGGIAGYNAKVDDTVGRIGDCDNYGTVTSKGSGYAAGICAVNDMKVLRCKNYGMVYAAEGMGNGVVAFNRDGAQLVANDSSTLPEKYIDGGAFASANGEAFVSANAEDLATANTETVATADGDALVILKQDKPEIIDTYECSTDRNLVYTFRWDVDKQYEDALYDAKLLGINEDGSLDLLGEQTNLSVATASFEDVQDLWNYKKMKLIVTRQGCYDKETNTDIFSETSEMDYKSKVRLGTVTVDTALLTRASNGGVNRDSLTYAVSFKPLQTASEKQTVSLYKIIVQKAVQKPDGTVINEVCFEQNISSEDVDYEQEMHTEIVDLSQFEGEKELNISVRAIANSDSAFYRDSRLGDSYVLALPSRLEAVSATTVTTDIGEEAVEEAKLNNDGIKLSVSDIEMDAYTGKYELAVAIYDSCEEASTTKENAKDAGTEDGLTHWNTGAIRTIASKTAPFVMNGEALNQADYILGSNVKLSDYAGKWLKVAIRSVGEDYLNSAWSDEDEDGETTNYMWIQIPKVYVDMPAFGDDDSLTSVAAYYDGTSWTDEIPDDCVKALEQRAIVLKECDYADEYDMQIIDDSVRRVSIVKRQENNRFVYDVYYLGYDSGRITGVTSDSYDFWNYIGTLDEDTDCLDLPYAREFTSDILIEPETEAADADNRTTEAEAEDADNRTTETEAAEADNRTTKTIQYSKHASIQKTEAGFMLVLPYEWNEFNGTITAQACATEDAYLNSKIGCLKSYFENDRHIEKFETLDSTEASVVTEVPDVLAKTEAIDLDNITVTYNMTSKSNLILAEVLVLDENNNLKWAEYKKISMEYNTVDELMHGSMTMDAKEYFITEPKQKVLIRYAAIDTYGLGVWTDFYELTVDGLGSSVTF